MLKWLQKSFLILIIFVPFATLLPLAAMRMTRTPEGVEFWFWVAPWSCCFWVLVYSQLSSAPWRRGPEAVRQWREAHGGLFHTSFFACCWMFGALFCSYAAELLLLFFVRRLTPWLPLATYSPLAFCWLWRRLHA